MHVREKDVIGPFLALFIVNFLILMIWTLVDPLKWVRLEVLGEEWKTYGTCMVEKGIGNALFYLVSGVNFCALVLACVQAYKARDLSEEFSESRSVGVAVFTWLQVSIVAIPVLFLIDPENFAAVYMLQVACITILSMSMMVLIFAPLVNSVIKSKRNPSSVEPRTSVFVSGLDARSSSGPGGVARQSIASVGRQSRLSVASGRSSIFRKEAPPIDPGLSHMSLTQRIHLEQMSQRRPSVTSSSGILLRNGVPDDSQSSLTSANFSPNGVLVAADGGIKRKLSEVKESSHVSEVSVEFHSDQDDKAVLDERLSSSLLHANESGSFHPRRSGHSNELSSPRSHLDDRPKRDQDVEQAIVDSIMEDLRDTTVGLDGSATSELASTNVSDPAGEKASHDIFEGTMMDQTMEPTTHSLTNEPNAVEEMDEEDVVVDSHDIFEGTMMEQQGGQSPDSMMRDESSQRRSSLADIDSSPAVRRNSFMNHNHGLQPYYIGSQGGSSDDGDPPPPPSHGRRRTTVGCPHCDKGFAALDESTQSAPNFYRGDAHLEDCIHCGRRNWEKVETGKKGSSKDSTRRKEEEKQKEGKKRWKMHLW